MCMFGSKTGHVMKVPWRGSNHGGDTLIRHEPLRLFKIDIRHNYPPLQDQHFSRDRLVRLQEWAPGETTSRCLNPASYLRRVRSVTEARETIAALIDRYHRHWVLIERFGVHLLRR